LTLAERRVEVVAEHARVERAADAAVAVLGGVDTVELRHQRGDLVGDAAIVSTPPGRVRSTNGRTCRQPTEAWPYQPASSPWRSRIVRKART
jgi:hypothetical protein